MSESKIKEEFSKLIAKRQKSNPRTPGAQLSVCLPVELKKHLMVQAYAEGISMTKFVIKLLNQNLK
jgi:predicted HicB family RNase H-like nuclease